MAPQATRIRILLSGILIHWPRLEASAEPICTIGPSRPTNPPTPIHSAEATALATLTSGRIGAILCAATAGCGHVAHPGQSAAMLAQRQPGPAGGGPTPLP